MIERRHHDRAFLPQVHLRWPAAGRTVAEIADNVSVGGALLNTDHTLPVGTEVDLEMRIGDDGRSGQVLAEVTRVEADSRGGKRVALRWLELPSALERELRHTLGESEPDADSDSGSAPAPTASGDSDLDATAGDDAWHEVEEESRAAPGARAPAELDPTELEDDEVSDLFAAPDDLDRASDARTSSASAEASTSEAPSAASASSDSRSADGPSVSGSPDVSASAVSADDFRRLETDLRRLALELDRERAARLAAEEEIDRLRAALDERGVAPPTGDRTSEPSKQPAPQPAARSRDRAAAAPTSPPGATPPSSATEVPPPSDATAASADARGRASDATAATNLAEVDWVGPLADQETAAAPARSASAAADTPSRADLLLAELEAESAASGPRRAAAAADVDPAADPLATAEIQAVADEDPIPSRSSEDRPKSTVPSATADDASEPTAPVEPTEPAEPVETASPREPVGELDLEFDDEESTELELDAVEEDQEVVPAPAAFDPTAEETPVSADPATWGNVEDVFAADPDSPDSAEDARGPSSSAAPTDAPSGAPSEAAGPVLAARRQHRDAAGSSTSSAPAATSPSDASDAADPAGRAATVVVRRDDAFGSLGPDDIDSAEEFDEALRKGAHLVTTERFQRLEPVSRSDILAVDWLETSKTWSELTAQAEGKMSVEELQRVLRVFFDRGLIRLRPTG